jgi:hypothetical protein
MSRVAASHEIVGCSPEQMEQLLAWYKIRDTLCGENCVKQDVRKARELAAACQHSDAVWLTKLFDSCNVNTKGEAQQVLLECESDKRAVCFAAVMAWDEDEIRRAADLGDAYAQAMMERETKGGGSFRWAEKSAGQKERDGYYALGRCLEFGAGCEVDLEKAKQNYLIGALLGHVQAMWSRGNSFERAHSERIIWLGRAAAGGGACYQFTGEIPEQMRLLIEGIGHSNLVFEIGRALKGQIDNEKKTLFGTGFKAHERIGPANQAVEFYHFQLLSYRRAVDSWTLIGLRNRVVKDIRNMIGKMIWDARDEAKYELVFQ